MPDAQPIPKPKSHYASSGDLLADRRYGYAEAFLKEKDAEAAADVMRQVIERVPDWAPAWLGLGDAEWLGQNRDSAIEAWRQCLSLDEADVLGARPRLARAGVTDIGAALGHHYIAALFDDYADRFDSHLTGALDYRAPELLASAILAQMDPIGRVYDLGCGTGLMAQALKGHVDFMAGCDLSAAMVAEAQAKGLYQHLACQDVVAALSEENPERFDLVVAADVFVYIADLLPIFLESQRVLCKGGLFAFTAQSTVEDHVVIGEDLRAAHPQSQLIAWAQLSGFEVISLEPVSVRQDRGQPVPGWLGMMRKA